MSKQTWSLRRRLPSGEVKTTGPFPHLGGAIRFAGLNLMDNTGCPKAEAHDLVQRLIAGRGADWVEHTSGYAYRVVAE